MTNFRFRKVSDDFDTLLIVARDEDSILQHPLAIFDQNDIKLLLKEWNKGGNADVATT